ncbi:Nop14-like protein [Annulohypoxylon maeteangense]|uniref:Nop14-like protein n=1 Tax=Annulohypoxylon maeteangense TaxID=1927788 RepID=UPI0020078EC9|nr:Nop14-like protein [Annulohypoxylon maeteangense]KAI0889955.1 Nop14-like protein [Annulohypoxylon maeteangense]
MPGSQLKRLKASLRDKGVIGPQLSKKQKKRNAQDGKTNNNRRFQKAAELEGIREEFNPFDFKHNVRGPKFQVTTNRPATSNATKGRPSEAKSLGEERRRQTLLVELNRRNKVGGILDRRFGENDPFMTPEEKMQERFVREKQTHKSSTFDLEDDDFGEGLTHLGKSLSFDKPGLVDDFEEDLSAGSDAADSDDEHRGSKRMRPLNDDTQDDDQEEGQPERKKTKQEVMKEVIAKSKFYKAERQAAKDADEDLREELDMELPDLHDLLFNRKKAPSGTESNTAESAAAGKERMERDYDMRLRQLAQDRRAQPTDRTKTEEEKAQEESKRLKELEDKRLKRMRGEEVSDDEIEEDTTDIQPEDLPAKGPVLFTENEEDDFGLGKGIKTRPTATELGFDDEDDFVIEDNLIASDSDLEPIESGASSNEEESDAEDDDEFTKGLLNEEETQNPVFSNRFTGSNVSTDTKEDSNGLPYTFPCPETLDEFVKMTQNIPIEHLPAVVQRVRALYHPKLDSDNKAKLAKFVAILIQYLAHSSNLPKLPPFSVLENLVRHIHSLAKSYPVETANEFRSRLEDFGQSRPLSPNLGDLIILSAIGTIFPTSDHFHQVTTPAGLLIARNLEKVPKKVTDYAQGAYLSTLALQYQQVSKRYVPEAMNFCLNTLCALAPEKAAEIPGYFPVHEPTPGTRISNAQLLAIRKLSPADCIKDDITDEEAVSTKVAILAVTVQLVDAAADLYSGKPAFFETFEPAKNVLNHLVSKPCQARLPATLVERFNKLQSKLDKMLGLAQVARRPLELHHHRPLPIKLAIPKFEDSFDPNKHYDPDRDRAELAKLKAEHKKERKGAMRELRKDANFMAREQLRMKRAKDAAYEKKYKRLVAEIQGEEGREANAYEREKEARKRASKR